MKTEKGQIIVNGKTFEATKVDFDNYIIENGNINLNNKTYTASKVIGNNQSN